MPRQEVWTRVDNEDQGWSYLLFSRFVGVGITCHDALSVSIWGTGWTIWFAIRIERLHTHLNASEFQFLIQSSQLLSRVHLGVDWCFHLKMHAETTLTLLRSACQSYQGPKHSIPQPCTETCSQSFSTPASWSESNSRSRRLPPLARDVAPTLPLLPDRPHWTP